MDPKKGNVWLPFLILPGELCLSWSLAVPPGWRPQGTHLEALLLLPPPLLLLGFGLLLFLDLLLMLDSAGQVPGWFDGVLLGLCLLFLLDCLSSKRGRVTGPELNPLHGSES